MSADSVISVQGVSKAYRIWESPSARLTAPLQESAASVLPGATGQWLKQRAARSYRDFWALKDISFEVKKGESVGIIGRNGSGKSTLLQIIAGTLQPTSGTVKVNGRVAALLELGSGFNPEFTGRENVYLNGAVLGLTRRDVDERFDGIASFADIGAFIDQPVKTYSSGMLVRLAFAVQTAIEPEVLIVDEALAVGDEAFQRKCFARIECLRAQGTTFLLVSHDIHTVTRICSRAVHINEGFLITNGLPGIVTKLYQRSLYSSVIDWNDLKKEFNRLQSTNLTRPQIAHSSEPSSGLYDVGFVSQSRVNYPEKGASISDVRITTLEGDVVNHLVIGMEYLFVYRVRFDRNCANVVLASGLRTKDGLDLSGMHSHKLNEGIAFVKAGTQLNINFHFRCDLNPGTYFMNAGVLADDGSLGMTYIHRIVDATIFKVFADAPLRSTAICRLVHECTFEYITEANL